MYTYRDVKSGEAYRGLLESLGWKKPRKKEATFTKTYPTGLLFEAYFGYATFNHYPGNFSGIPVFRVISPQWRKLTRKLGLNSTEGLLYFLDVTNPIYTDFVNQKTRMSYLTSFDDLDVDSFTRFNTAADTFMGSFQVENYITLPLREFRITWNNTSIPAMVGYLAMMGDMSSSKKLYDHTMANGGIDYAPSQEDLQTIANHYHLDATSSTGP